MEISKTFKFNLANLVNLTEIFLLPLVAAGWLGSTAPLLVISIVHQCLILYGIKWAGEDVP
jgi:hypothetical protein